MKFLIFICLSTITIISIMVYGFTNATIGVWMIAWAFMCFVFGYGLTVMINDIFTIISTKYNNEIVVTKNENGTIVAVTRQDLDGKFLKIIAESDKI